MGNTPRIDRHLIYGLKDPVTGQIRYVVRGFHYDYTGGI